MAKLYSFYKDGEKIKVDKKMFLLPIIGKRRVILNGRKMEADTLTISKKWCRIPQVWNVTAEIDVRKRSERKEERKSLDGTSRREERKAEPSAEASTPAEANRRR